VTVRAVVGSDDDVVGIAVVLVVELLESSVEAARLEELVDVVVTELVVAAAELVVTAAELVVTAAELVGWALELLVVSAEGGMTLKLTVAPHSSREAPVGQQPALVQ